MTKAVSIAVFGASGRMGQAVLRLAFRDARARVVAALARPESDAHGVALRDAFGDAAAELRYAERIDRDAAPDVLVDFSVASAFDAALAEALARRIAFVSGTTGLSPGQHDALRKAAATIPVLWSANFSLGVAVLTRLAREAARTLSSWDCEIAETHHRHKKDAPSGTALALGRAVAEARSVEFERVAALDRTANATTRDPSAIGFAVMRSGDVIGEHTVLFATDGERIELTHRASDRDIFARGALEAALWLARQPPGLHALDDMLESVAG